jgi:hypothetical protein
MLIALGLCTIPAGQASAFELWGGKHDGCACGAPADCGHCGSPCKSKCGLFGGCRDKCGGCKSRCGGGLFGRKCGGCNACGSSCGCRGKGLFSRMFRKDCGCHGGWHGDHAGCATCGDAGAIVPAPPADGQMPPEPAPMEEAQPQASRSNPSYSSQSLPYRIIRNNR